MTVGEKQRTGAEDVRWDLSDLYPSPEAPEIDADMQAADALADTFAETYRGKVATLDAEELREALETFESIVTYLTKIGSYAQLIWTTDTQNPVLGKLMAKAQEFGSTLQQKLLFFDIEWKNLSEDAAKIADHPVLESYRHYLISERLMQPYTLTEPEEKVISRMSLAGMNAWSRYFGEVMSNSRFEWEGDMVTQSDILSLTKSPDRDVRQRAAESITKTLGDMTHTTTYVFNMMLLDKQQKDEMRGYKTWVSSRNMSNQVDDETVDALVEAVTSRYDVVSRYYNLMKKVLGVDELYDYDRYAPVEEVEKFITWDEARTIVTDAYGRFDPRMAEIVAKFFDNNWIDAPIKMGKRGGAYSASTSSTVHPYIFMNFDGKMNDVMTLAHELGHGIHQYLSREQGELLADTPLTTAEMASTFGEMLVFDYLIEREEDPKVRFSMRMERIADTFATVYRQISMNRFEDGIHNARREQGELSTDQITDIWLKTQRDMFGDSLTMRDEYGLWWSYIPHFIGVPGYVYAYSFGELLVWALYAKYQQGLDGFQNKYYDVLRAGGSDFPPNILAPLDVDLRDPKFWHDGLNLLDEFVAQTEQDFEAL